MDADLLFAIFIALVAFFLWKPLGALVVLPEGQQRSGSIGGTVWSHNSSGAYIRNRSVPVNPNTARQVLTRNAVRSISIAWQNTLTQAQRDAWGVYAANVDWKNKLGQSILLTGLNHFLRSNTPRVINGLARVDIAPVIFNLATAELELAVTASEATQDLTVDGDLLADWVGEADAWQFFYMGLPQNGGIGFFGGPYRLLRAVPGAGPPPFPFDAPAVFPFAEGQRLWVRSRIARGDGRLSEFAEVNFLAGA
ncbi:hypothetical protein ES703_72566 [subsurface metagenome]